jgi:hypothetical protein
MRRKLNRRTKERKNCRLLPARLTCPPALIYADRPVKNNHAKAFASFTKQLEKWLLPQGSGRRGRGNIVDQRVRGAVAHRQTLRRGANVALIVWAQTNDSVQFVMVRNRSQDTKRFL